MSNLETDSHSYYSFYPLCIKYYGSRCWTFLATRAIRTGTLRTKIQSMLTGSKNWLGCYFRPWDPWLIIYDLWKLWRIKINGDINVARLWQDGDSLVSGNVVRKDEKMENVSKIKYNKFNIKNTNKGYFVRKWSNRGQTRVKLGSN